MKQGTIRRKRGAPMRQEVKNLRTRDSRQRYSPTENGHAALHLISNVTRAYQNDSSSKHPCSSAALGLKIRIRPSPVPGRFQLTESVHIRGEPACSPQNQVNQGCFSRIDSRFCHPSILDFTSRHVFVYPLPCAVNEPQMFGDEVHATFFFNSCFDNGLRLAIGRSRTFGVW